jgi:hypothetical protein
VKRITLAIMLGLGLLAATAQLPNDSLARQLMRQYFETHAGPYLSLGGVPPEVLPDSLRPDSQATLRLQFLTPQVTYEPLPARRYLRRIEVPFSLEDSLLRDDRLVYVDTLTKAGLRRVLRLTPLDYQGEDPRRWGKWGRGITLVGGSLLLTALLFYVRGGG